MPLIVLAIIFIVHKLIRKTKFVKLDAWILQPIIIMINIIVYLGVELNTILLLFLLLNIICIFSNSRLFCIMSITITT